MSFHLQNQRRGARRTAGLVLATLLLASAPSPLAAQLQSTAQASASSSPAVVNGPVIVQGTRFLVRLEDKINSRKDKPGKKFEVKTAEPLQVSDGSLVPAGSEIKGHVSRIEKAGVTGRARVWLVFDEIKTKNGKFPIVADVVDVPGDHAVKVSSRGEGEIATKTSKGQQEIIAAATGAAIGAVVGATAKGGKGAGVGALIGAAAGFLVASGIGQELELPKGAKMELELTRTLYVGRQK